MNGVELSLPPGFRFHPTDEELVLHYLCRKCTSQPIAVPIIAEIDLYKHDPWQLPELARYGEKEWYFFSPRDRKYPNGSRPNRAAGTGYWKATGADKPIGKPKPVGIKKALVFYSGKAPKGEKTNWIMHEYRLADVDRSVRKRNSLRLDDWVLCRIYNKKGGGLEKQSLDVKSVPSIPHVPKLEAPPPLPPLYTVPPSQLTQPQSQQQQQPQQQQQVLTDYMYFDTSDSILKSHPDSSCSEQVRSSSPDFAYGYEREVQSHPTRWKTSAAIGSHQLPTSLPQSSESIEIPAMFRDSNMMQEIFMYLQKPF